MKHIFLNQNFESEFESQLKRALTLGLWPDRKKSTVEKIYLTKSTESH